MAEDRQTGPLNGSNRAQPGQVIVPSGIPRKAEKRTVVLGTPTSSPEPLPSSEPTAVTPPSVESSPLPRVPVPEAQELSPQAQQPIPPSHPPTPHHEAVSESEDGLSWTAAEFIAHNKTAGWYFALFGIAILLAAVILGLTRDKISAATVLISALVLGMYSARRPRHLQYRLDQEGVTIGSKYHTYAEFRSFALVPEGQLSSAVFMPLKRFAPTLTIYFPPEAEDKVAGLLSDSLPFEDHISDLVDRFTRRIKF